MKRLLTVEEAAEYTGFTIRYLRRLIFERRLAYHKDRRRVWLATEDLDAFICGLRVEPGTMAQVSRRGGARLERTPARR